MPAAEATRRGFIAGAAALGAVGLAASAAKAAAQDTTKNIPTRKEGAGMLKGISPAISPDLLKTLAEMGHGDEIVFSDAHFPGHSVNARVLRSDGLAADVLLAGVAPLFELDSYATPVAMMSAVPGDTLDPTVEARYRKALGYTGEIERVERYAFYERAKKAYAVVITGETAKYGNVILKKGVVPVS